MIKKKKKEIHFTLFVFLRCVTRAMKSIILLYCHHANFLFSHIMKTMNADFLLSQVISFTLQSSFSIILIYFIFYTSYKLRFILLFPFSSSITDFVFKMKRDNNHSWCRRCYKWCNLTNFFITETWRKFCRVCNVNF